MGCCQCKDSKVKGSVGVDPPPQEQVEPTSAVLPRQHRLNVLQLNQPFPHGLFRKFLSIFRLNQQTRLSPPPASVEPEPGLDRFRKCVKYLLQWEASAGGRADVQRPFCSSMPLLLEPSRRRWCGDKRGCQACGNFDKFALLPF